jgi:hypothetical protein
VGLVEREIGCAGAVEGGEVPHRGEGEDQFVRVVFRAGRDGVVFDHDDRAGWEGGDVGEELVAEDEVEALRSRGVHGDSTTLGWFIVSGRGGGEIYIIGSLLRVLR